MTLDEARRERDRRRDRARAAHARHMTPVAPRVDRNMTVKAVAELWIDNRKGTGRWKSLTYPRSVRQRLKDYVYPIIGPGYRPLIAKRHADAAAQRHDCGGGRVKLWDDPRVQPGTIGSLRVSCVTNVNERNGHLRYDVGRNLVHRVRTQNNRTRTGAFETQRYVR